MSGKISFDRLKSCRASSSSAGSTRADFLNKDRFGAGGILFSLCEAISKQCYIDYYGKKCDTASCEQVGNCGRNKSWGIGIIPIRRHARVHETSRQHVTEADFHLEKKYSSDSLKMLYYILKSITASLLGKEAI